MANADRAAQATAAAAATRASRAIVQLALGGGGGQGDAKAVRPPSPLAAALTPTQARSSCGPASGRLDGRLGGREGGCQMMRSARLAPSPLETRQDTTSNALRRSWQAVVVASHFDATTDGRSGRSRSPRSAPPLPLHQDGPIIFLSVPSQALPPPPPVCAANSAVWSKLTKGAQATRFRPALAHAETLPRAPRCLTFMISDRQRATTTGPSGVEESCSI